MFAVKTVANKKKNYSDAHALKAYFSSTSFNLLDVLTVFAHLESYQHLLLPFVHD